MKSIKEWTERIRGFFGDVVVELKKCAWPTGRELAESTMVVILSMVMVAVYIGLSDTVIMAILQALVRRGG